jgi:hypothetical protein
VPRPHFLGWIFLVFFGCVAPRSRVAHCLCLQGWWSWRPASTRVPLGEVEKSYFVVEVSHLSCDLEFLTSPIREEHIAQDSVMMTPSSPSYIISCKGARPGCWCFVFSSHATASQISSQPPSQVVAGQLSQSFQVSRRHS